MNRSTGGTTIRGGGAAGAPRQSPAEFVRGVVLELRRVTWPSREEWISATLLTIALVVGIGFFTWGVDQILSYVFNVIHPV
ncbi:MAG: preprotein translocase subunit SecE [Candidatus Meridianibacter frigidus]|nr:MAG: preprotein translocase subunit SecE [Candidatus Eremiobacteraeota bacterium]